MKSPKTLSLTGMLLCIIFLLSQCKNRDGSEIPYNKENAKEHIISIRTAAELTSTFKREKIALNRQMKDTTYLEKNFNLPFGEKFNRDAIAALLNQKGAKGIRIYLGQDKNGLVRLVLVAVNERGTDITGTPEKTVKFASSGTEAFALEAGQRCPTLCSLQNPVYK